MKFYPHNVYRTKLNNYFLRSDIIITITVTTQLTFSFGCWQLIWDACLSSLWGTCSESKLQRWRHMSGLIWKFWYGLSHSVTVASTWALRWRGNLYITVERVYRSLHKTVKKQQQQWFIKNGLIWIIHKLLILVWSKTANTSGSTQFEFYHFCTHFQI